MKQRRILVVDDEPGMLRAVRRVLERSNEVVCAASPGEAIVAVEDWAPDLAIVDIRMPDADGFELTGRLKERHPGLDVILMTGSVSESDRKLIRAIREKAFYFLQKPFDRDVLQTLVERCFELRTLAEDNRRHVRRLEAELAEARTFQASLVPGPEARLGEVLLSAGYVSCDELCGDLYDYTAVGPGRVAFLVADVSGHGASAAMLTGVVKSAFQSCHSDGCVPLDVVDRISAGIQTFNANRFVSLFCGVLDLGEDRLDFVNAGHPPGFLRDGEGRVERLGATGPIVSPVFGRGAWKQETREFSRDHGLLLYTDGVFEAPGETDFFGLERIEQRVAATPEGGRPLVDAVLEDVRVFMKGRSLVDDLTLLAVRPA